MTGQILVPLDGSPTAEAILEPAQRWARTTRRGLLLLSVLWPPRVPDPLTGEVDETMTVSYPHWEAAQQRARAYLQTVVARLESAGLPATVQIREGDPATEIVSVAAGDPAVQGVAMTTHGRGGLARIFFGSVAETVLLTSPRPLLVVRPPVVATAPASRPAAYQTILVPLDGSPSAEVALPLAQSLARSSGARLTLALAQAAASPGGMTELSWTMPEMQTDDLAATQYLEGMARRLTAQGLTVGTRILIGSPAAALVQYAARTQADLIVMATHVRQGLDRVIYGSVGWEVVQHAGCPVMLVHTDADPLALTAG